MKSSVNQLLRPRNQRGVPFLPICILCMRVSKDAWLCQLAAWVSPLFHCVDSTRMQIWRGRLPGLFCTTWAMLFSSACVCKWVYGLSVLNAGMRRWLKNEHARPWSLFYRPLKKLERLKLRHLHISIYESLSAMAFFMLKCPLNCMLLYVCVCVCMDLDVGVSVFMPVWVMCTSFARLTCWPISALAVIQRWDSEKGNNFFSTLQSTEWCVVLFALDTWHANPS